MAFITFTAKKQKTEIPLSASLLGISVLLLVEITPSQAQTWNWGNSPNGTGIRYATEIAADNNNNMIMTGIFRDSISFSNTKLKVTKSGMYSSFIAKYNNYGTLQWAKKPFSTKGFSDIYGLHCDKTGNIFITGYFTDSLFFDTADTLVQGVSTGGDIYFAKFNNNGSFIWAKHIKGGLGSSGNQGSSITANDSGDIFVSGKFVGTTYFDNIVKTSTSNGGDCFIAKYDKNGIIKWVKSAGNNSPWSDEYCLVNELIVDSFGYIYAGGTFHGNTSFGTTSLISYGSTSTGNLTSDAFISKYNDMGSLLWVKQIGGKSYDFSSEVSTDNKGNCYITGGFADTASFGGTNLISSGNYDIFIAKYDSSGSVKWAKKAGGSDEDRVRGIITDKTGTSYITGFFSDTATFGNTTLTCKGLHDLYIAKYDDNGSLHWVEQVGEYSKYFGNNDSGFDICFSNLYDALFVCGSFRDSLALDSIILTPSNNSEDIFWAKLSVSTATGGIYSSYTKNTALIYPNPLHKGDKMHVILNPETIAHQFDLTDYTGRVVDSRHEIYQNEGIRIENISTGIYFYSIVTDRGTFNGKLCVVE